MVSLSRHLTLRLTDEEMAVLDAGCRSLGLNRSAFLRFALQQTAGASDVGRRLSDIEDSIAEILGLLRSGGVSVASGPPARTEQDDGMREELARSVRGILDGEI